MNLHRALLNKAWRVKVDVPWDCHSNRAGDPPVYPNVLPGDVGRTIGRQQRDQLGNLFRSAIAPHRNPVKKILLFRQTVDEAGKHVVHADVLSCIFVCEQLGVRGKTCPKNS
mgnify:CR=1 FL=1